MHEVGIMESALETVERQAREHGAQRIHRIVLRIGSLSGVDVDSLRFAFDAVASSTLAAGAELGIEQVAARAYCKSCDADFAPGTGWIFTCPRCGNLSSDVCQGRELELARIEMS